jgi:hypothetical protein
MLVEMIINKEEKNVSKNNDEKQLIVLILTTKFKAFLVLLKCFIFFPVWNYHIKM